MTRDVEEALRLAERALRNYPMQAFRTKQAQPERARALDAVQDVLAAGRLPAVPADQIEEQS